MHEVNPEGVFKQLERVTRERDEALAALRKIAALHPAILSDRALCDCDMHTIARTALLPEKQKTEGK